MVSQSIICNNNINRANPGVYCSGPCHEHYHYTCLNLAVNEKTVLLNSTNIKWVCDNCNQQVSTEPGHNEIVSKLNAVMTELKELSNNQTKMLESVNYCSGKIDDFQAKLNTFSDKIKLIEPLKQEFDEMKIRLNDLEQRSRFNNIEMVGVPEKAGENIHEIIKLIGHTVQCPIDSNDIDSCHRVSHYSYSEHKPKSIIVKFVSKIKKDNLMAAVKKHKNLRSSDLNLTGTNRIYVNDHLVPSSKLLLKKTKEVATNKNYKYTWVKNSKIFVRKNDGSPILYIKTEKDLNKLQ